MTLRNIFQKFFKPCPTWSTPPAIQYGFEYGFLAVIIVLLAWSFHWLLTLSASYTGDRYSNLVVCLMLLFNHLGTMFRLPPRLTIAFRTLAMLWLAFGLFYIFYRYHVLLP